MSKLILTDAGIYVAKQDLSGETNEGSLELTRDFPEVTNFDSNGWKEKLPGLMDFSLSLGMYFDNTEEITEDLFAKIGLANEVFIITPTKTAGEVAYFGDSPAGEYTPLEGGVGDPLRSRISMQGGGVGAKQISRGKLDPVKTTASAAGQSAGVQLGAVGATQELVAVIILVEFTGTSITFKVESDDNSGFTTASDVITTFTAMTARDGQFGLAAGAIADDYFRFDFSGTFSNAVFVGALGIREA